MPEAWDPITAGIVSGGVGALGTLTSGIMNQGNAREQMNFQRDMSSTAHQREVQDLRAAGLNPILSALGSGASTPSGAAGTMGDLGTPLGTGIETAIAAKDQQFKKQIQDEQIKNLGAQNEKMGVDNENTKMDTINKAATAKLINEQTKSTAAQTRHTQTKNLILLRTAESIIKKAMADGDFAKAEKIMGLINSGVNSAAGAAGMVDPISRGAKGVIDVFKTKKTMGF